MIYDLIIVGGSAAATAAGIYAARRKLHFKIISEDFGGEVATSGEIENYPGFSHTDGIELTEKFRAHLKSYDVEPELSIVVRKIRKEGSRLTIEAQRNGEVLHYETKSVILTTGVKPRELNIPGEKEFRGKGVSYCTVCDGPLYKNKVVATVGGGNSALESVLMLTHIATKVYLITKNPHMKGDEVLIEKVMAAENVDFITNGYATKITGDGFVRGLEYQKKETGETTMLDVQGIFVHIGMVPNSSMIDGVEKNRYGEIVVDRLGRTNIEGLFVAGDVTDIPYKQIAIACGQGTAAALTAVDYLNRLKD